MDVNRLFDHSAFVELHAALLDALEQGAMDAEIDARLEAMQAHLQRQFSAEEQVMQAAKLSAAEPHKKHHDRALAKLAQRQTRWCRERHRRELQNYLENELAEWFVSHVNLRDYISARHLSLLQLTEQQTG